MIIASPIHLIDEIEVLLRSKGIKNLKHAKNEFFHIWYDGFDLQQTNNILSIIIGDYFFPNADQTNPEFRALPYMECLRRAIGYFLYITLDGESFNIITSLYRPYSIFFTSIGKDRVFSDDLSFLVEMRGQLHGVSVDIDYCISVITGTFGYGNATLFSEVRRLQAGEKISLHSNGQLSAEIYNAPQASGDDIASMIYRNLKSLIPTNKKTYLMMSGGLDSGYLFCLMAKSDIEFIALHNESSVNLRESELDNASKLAEELEQKLTIVSGPEDVIGEIKESGVISLADLVVNNRGVFITGFGGDQVFLQNPRRNVCFDAYKSRGFAGVLNTARAYSWLKKDNFYLTIADFFLSVTIPRYMSVNLIDRPPWIRKDANIGHYSKHYLLDKIDTRSAKYYHVQSIIGACSASMGFGSDQVTHHPFLMQNVIGSLIDMPVYEMFTADYDRIVLRADLFKRYGNVVAWRRTKKPSTSAVMKEINQNMDLLCNTISNSFLVDRGIIDCHEVISNLEKSALIGLSKDYHFISRFIQIESQIQLYMDRYSFIG